MQETFSSAENEFLEFMRVGALSTITEKRTPHLVPLCYALNKGKLIVGTGPKGKKIENVRDNPRVAFTVHEYSEDWKNLRAVIVEGEAKVLTQGPSYEAGKQALFAKYRQYEKAHPWLEGHDVILEITPMRVKSWGLEKRIQMPKVALSTLND